MKQIVRNDYMDTLVGLRDKNLIKVLTGVRRCGKSTVMQMFRDYLLADNVDANQIVFMNFEALENHKWLTDFEGLYYHIINQLDLSKPCYVFLDEVQQIPPATARLHRVVFNNQTYFTTITSSNNPFSPA